MLRSVSSAASPMALTTTMIQPIMCIPRSSTSVWNTTEIIAAEAIDPR